MNIPKTRIYYVNLRTADGSDIVINQPVRLAEPCYFITLKGMGFKKIWESDTSITYSQVSCRDLSSIAVTDHE